MKGTSKMKSDNAQKSRWQAQTDGARKANTGKKLTRKHKMRIKKAMKSLSRNVLIEASNGKDTHTFDSMAECARYLGCSRQLVSQCVRRPSAFKHAKGHVISVIEIES